MQAGMPIFAPVMNGSFERVEVNGVRLAVQRHRCADRANAPTLVFLHDSLGAITTWRDLPVEVGRALGADVLVYDRQGYGRSDAFGPTPRAADYMHREADVLEALLAREHIERAILFGHSDGGTIALLAAARHPRRIAAVITEGAHVFVEEVTLAGIRAAEKQFATTDLRARLVKHHGDRTDALFAAWTNTWQAPFFRDWDITAEITAIRCPVLVLQGVDDPYGTEAQVEAIVQAVGEGAVKYMVPGARHTPHKEAPAITMELVLQFLRDRPAADQ
jgi:pimeloyl-ACP methyl ester carboxylesterase